MIINKNKLILTNELLILFSQILNESRGEK